MRGAVVTIRAFLALISIFIAACGGGGGTGGVRPSPPAPDFSIGLSAESLSISQGATSAPVTFSISAENGFTSDVNVSLAGLPSGVVLNPSSPFSIAAGQSVSVLFVAGPNASTGQFILSVQGTSGPLSHSKTFSLSIQAA